ncbi:hypothetical protein AGMMS50284_3900 [Clostridia bacterium]|nr:hypothetical protein AGMMS50284_3900 [Clostridia bacterium]
MQYVVFIFGIVITAALYWLFKKLNFKDKKDKLVKSAAMALVIALVLEFAVFNYKTFQNFSGDEKLHYNLSTAANNEKDGVNVEVFETNDNPVYIVSFNNINIKVDSIKISPTTNSKTINCDIIYTDEAFSEMIPMSSNVTIVNHLETTTHITPHMVGNTGNISFRLTAESHTKISAVNIDFNVPSPLSFNLLRVVICFALFFFLLFLRRKAGESPVIFNAKSQKQRRAVLAFIAIQLIIISFNVFAPFAVFDDNGNFTKFELLQSHDIYHELSEAILEGHIDLNVRDNSTGAIDRENDSIAKLEELDNVYDPTQRDGIELKWDHAFYNGKYYSYFGVVPVFVLYLPSYFLTGKLISSQMVSYIFACFAAVFMSLSVFELAKRWKSKPPLILVIAAMAALCNGSMLMYSLAGSLFYEVATLSAQAFVSAGFYFILRACNKENLPKASLAMGALCMALAVGCRPNFLLASFVTVTFVWQALQAKNQCNPQATLTPPQNKIYSAYSSLIQKIKSVFCKENLPQIFSFAVPYAIVGFGLMIYNYVRFDSFFEFGAAYQLTVSDITKSKAVDLSKLPIMLAQYMWMVPQFTTRFPFVFPKYEGSNYLGYYYGLNYFGIYANPLLWLTAMLPWSLKRGLKENKLRLFAVLSLAIGLFMALLCTSMGGTSLRYAADFAWLLFLPAIVIAFNLYEAASKRKIAKYVYPCLLILAFSSALMNILISISPDKSQLSEKAPQIFYWLQYMVTFWR